MSSPTSTRRSPPAILGFRRARKATAASFSEGDGHGQSRRHSKRMTRRSTMAKETRKGTGRNDSNALSTDELESQVGEQLPDREQMSLVNANVAAPINLALAANILSDSSVAEATATQYAPITQGNI